MLGWEFIPINRDWLPSNQYVLFTRACKSSLNIPCFFLWGENVKKTNKRTNNLSSLFWSRGLTLTCSHYLRSVKEVDFYLSFLPLLTKSPCIYMQLSESFNNTFWVFHNCGVSVTLSHSMYWFTVLCFGDLLWIHLIPTIWDSFFIALASFWRTGRCRLLRNISCPLIQGRYCLSKSKDGCL